MNASALHRKISVQGARTHNLKNISLEMPKGQLVVITGVSGSGKSSLAFHTIYAEAQRLFIEGLGIQAQKTLSRLPRPDVDSIAGLSPAIAVEQRWTAPAFSSRFGDLAEVLPIFRLLFARAGLLHCPECGVLIDRSTKAEILRSLRALPEKTRLQILAPLPDANCEDLIEILLDYKKQGFVRVRVAAEIESIDFFLSELEAGALESAKGSEGKLSLALVIDRLVVSAELGNRLSDSVELALAMGANRLLALSQHKDARGNGWEERQFATAYSCPNGDFSLDSLSADIFSPGNPLARCRVCGGEGSSCSACKGSGYSELIRSIRIQGMNLAELEDLPLMKVSSFLRDMKEEETFATILAAPVDAALERTRSLTELNLGHLNLGRRAEVLSSGEHGRLRVARQLGNPLAGILYVFDEPCRHLSSGDAAAVIASLRRLSERGNSVLVVEHNLEVIAAADYLFEIGPGAGVAGGELIFAGSYQQLLECENSSTAAFLSGKPASQRGRKGRKTSGRLVFKIEKQGCLENLELQIPLAAMTFLYGSSGSGKTRIIEDLLLKAGKKHISRAAGATPGVSVTESGSRSGSIAAVKCIDSTALGANARSTPATASGVLDGLRKLYASIPEAKARGYGAGRFSFNSRSGRCDHCHGLGYVTVEMHIMPDVEAPCPECEGRRFSEDTLQIRFKGYSIADALEMTVSEALSVFLAVPEIALRLKTLLEVGLGYLVLGQSALSISGGEAQRIKLAAELSKKFKGPTLYLLDAPTGGLHPSDVDRLLDVLRSLVDKGHTVVIADSDRRLAGSADWVIAIDRAPLGEAVIESGARTEIVFQGEGAEFA